MRYAHRPPCGIRATEVFGRVSGGLATLIITLLLWPPYLANADEFAVRVLQVDPASGEALYTGDALYVRIEYRSDVPLRFQVEGFYGGTREHGAHSNPAPVYPVGNGEAIAWLAFQGSAYLDEVRIKVSDRHWKLLDTIPVPVSIEWRGDVRPTRRATAAWVTGLNDIQQEMTRTALQQSAAGDDDAAWHLVILLMGWSIPAYFVLQYYMLRRYEYGWRKAAMLPLFGMVPLLAYTLFALAAGSNLWPLMLLLLTPFAFLYLVGLGVVKFLRQSSERAA